ncbi:MAG: DUF3343 domain-containing protein [Clostridiales bacterium]|nr:DUF3343 domain-containing protein [Clostridiales bacterium]
MISSITHALMGRDILRSKGLRAYVEKTPREVNHSGCSYSIFVDQDHFEEAEQLLKAQNVRIIGRSDRDMGGSQ